MPEFGTLAEADAWRAQNAPPRRSNPRKPPAPPPAAQSNGMGFISLPAAPPAAPTARPASEIKGDFETRVLAQADALVDIAYASAAAADPMSASVALRNWAEAAKQGAAAKEKVVALQIEQRELLRLDDALECVSVLLQSVRRRILKLGERAAAAANPNDPAAAKAAIDREVDSLLAELTGAASNIASALASGPSPDDADDAAEGGK